MNRRCSRAVGFAFLLVFLTGQAYVALHYLEHSHGDLYCPGRCVVCDCAQAPVITTGQELPAIIVTTTGETLLPDPTAPRPSSSRLPLGPRSPPATALL